MCTTGTPASISFEVITGESPFLGLGFYCLAHELLSHALFGGDEECTTFVSVLPITCLSFQLENEAC